MRTVVRSGGWVCRSLVTRQVVMSLEGMVSSRYSEIRNPSAFNEALLTFFAKHQ